MSEITIEPTGHYVLVEMVEIAKQSKGGIIFANVEKEQACLLYTSPSPRDV